ncbi:MAG: hypothetical protein J5594_02810 [Elusimicrobiaceae bacterium]|nr:hypothetical protein [Elusimicrobiaceae bacterium]
MLDHILASICQFCPSVDWAVGVAEAETCLSASSWRLRIAGICKLYSAGVTLIASCCDGGSSI